MSLSAHGLGIRLGGRDILRDVTLDLERGAFVGLVGPNGAGKTTLLRALAGLLAPSRGSVALDGRPISAITRDERARRIAAFFQGAEAGWPMTAAEVVRLGRLPHRGRRDGGDDLAVARAMARTDVAHLADRRQPTLSAGERMRVLLARALAVEAEWLLADEPITALDPGHQLDAMALLRGVARDGTGVVAVLHDLGLAARFCDRVVVIGEGMVAADGRPETALTDGLLASVFGITVRRGEHPDGTRYILPWHRSKEETDGAIP